MNITPDKVKQLLENATHGEWEAELQGGYIFSKDGSNNMIGEARGWGWLQYKGEQEAAREQDANCELLAAAPSIAKAYLDAMEKLERTNKLLIKAEKAAKQCG